MIPPCDSEDVCWRLGQIDQFHAMQHWLNWTPHAAQREILAGMQKNTTLVCGRRFGKSEMIAVDCIRFALTNRDTIQYCIGPTLEQAKIVFSAIRALAQKSPMIAPLIESTKDFPFPEITFRSGSTIYARSLGNDGAKRLRGYKAHRVIIDEAELVKEDELKTVLEPLLADYADLDIGGWMIKIGTPLGRNHFFESFQQGQRGEPEHASFRFNSFSNPHISHKYIESKRANMTDLQYRVEYLAEFVDDQVCVFRWESINDSLREYEYNFGREKEHQYYVGVDVAKMHDYTAIYVIDGTNPKECRVCYKERFTNKDYSFVVTRIMSIADQFQPLAILIDETGVGAGLTDQVKAELPNAEGFLFTQASKISLINTLKTGLEQNRIRLSHSDQTLTDELRYYEYKLNEESGNIKMTAPAGKFDDCVIALALAYMKCAVVWSDAEAVAIPAVGSGKALNMADNSIDFINGDSRWNPNGDQPPADEDPANRPYPPVYR